MTTNTKRNTVRLIGILSVGIVAAAFVGSAHATVFDVGTAVGTINGNGRPLLEATGNSMTAAAFSTALATAFANNTGGVWDAETNFTGAVTGDSFIIDYGVSGTDTLTLAFTGTSWSSSAGPGIEETSGANVFSLNSPAQGARVFTPNVPLLTVSIINTDRNSTATTYLSVTYKDGSTASTSGANGLDWYFHALSGTVDNPIISFSVNQSNYIRYDDLGFITVPKPKSGTLISFQ